MAKHKKKQQLTLPGLLLLIVFLGLSFLYNSLASPKQETILLSDIPAYSGSAYVTVNDNMPFFKESDYTTTSYESYSPLDELGRCGVAEALRGAGPDAHGGARLHRFREAHRLADRQI